MSIDRCDLALEATELLKEQIPPLLCNGIETSEKTVDDFKITTVKILNKEGEDLLKKPCGQYVTIELTALYRRDEDTFKGSVNAVAGELRQLLAPLGEEEAMVAGLGNREITPDALGPRVVSSLVITRHMDKELRQALANIRPVSALSPGVLGITGLETSEILRGVVDRAQPSFLIAVDALASRSLSRLCTTIQLADTGITPGSGVGNARSGINKDTLGIPVIAIGVPTVVDAKTIAADIMEETEQGINRDKLQSYKGGLMVTPKDIDSQIRMISRIIAYAINIALHKDWSIEDVDNYLM